MRIVDLPLEVLLLVYQSLSDIDDALHLGRACKRLNNIFDNPFSRVNIFRVIIQNQSQHMHDVKLTILQSHTQSCLSSLDPFAANAQNIPRSGPNVLNQALFPDHPHELSDTQVWEIVCRWLGMRSLFSLYSNSTIHSIYLSDWSPWWRTQSRPLGDPSLLQLCDQTIHQASNEERLLYHRFYQALTAHWLSIESLALAKATVYPTPESRDHWNTIIYDQWSGRRPLPLREKLDILHVTLFAWEFLARKLFETIPLVPRLEEFRKRKIFLRPPCLIQALILLDWPDPDSFCDPVGYFDRLTPEYMVQPVVLVGEEQDDAGYLSDGSDGDAGYWNMRLQDLEDEAYEYVRRVKIRPRATWRSFWPTGWGRRSGKQAGVGLFGDDRLDVRVLDRLFLHSESDERLLIDMLERI